MSDKSISEFINKDYKQYAKYVLYNRAIPNIIDGFKPVHRKIFYTALKYAKGQFIKTIGLVGGVIKDASYHHGDASLGAAVNSLTQDFVGSNNIPMFQGKGNFGNRLIQEAAAGRYTAVKLNNEFLNYFTDWEILDKNVDPENPEPLCYLPIIPWVLVNGVEGIAIGFATYILPRDPEKLKHYIKNKLEGKGSYYQFEPYFKGFKGKIEKDPDSSSWIMTGSYEVLKKHSVKITELPIGFDREKYISHLERLIEKKKIRDYIENCKNGFEFTIKFNKEYSDERIIHYLKLRTTLTENIVTIDNEGKLREFDKPDELVNYFIQYRLNKYHQRLTRNKQIAEDEILLIDEKKRFIELVMNNEIKVSKLTRQELIQNLKDEDFIFIQELINMKIYMFTSDEIDKLNDKKEELQKYVKELLETNPGKEWIKELK